MILNKKGFTFNCLLKVVAIKKIQLILVVSIYLKSDETKKYFIAIDSEA
jgi:hypothetical protein